MDIYKNLQKILGSYTEKPIKFSIPTALGKKTWHLATNAFFMIDLSKHKNIMERIQNLDYVSQVEKAGRGFLNIRFKSSHIKNHIHDIQSIGNNVKINIEFSSPNPTGPLHLGHWRGTFLGACVSNLLEVTGHNVTREMYINNAGSQFAKFLETINYHQGKKKCSIHYIGDYVKDYAKKLSPDYKPEDVINMMISQFQKVLKKAHITHDYVSLETDQLYHVKNLERNLLSKKLLIEGRMENQNSTGNVLYVNAEQYGENNFVFRKNDGKYTYAAYDCGYVVNKGERGFLNQFCLVGEDHLEHIKRIPGIMSQIGYSFKADYVGIVTFKCDGKVIKFSKRNGQIITLESMLNQNKYGALVNATLLRNSHESMEINLNEINAKDYFLIQHVFNTISIQKKSNIIFTDELIRLILEWPIIIRQQSLPKYDIHPVFKFGIKLCKYLNTLRIKEVNGHLYDIVHNIMKICAIRSL